MCTLSNIVQRPFFCQLVISVCYLYAFTSPVAGAEVYPAQIRLASGDSQQLLVSASATDVTRRVEYTVEDAALATVSDSGLVSAVQTGDTVIRIRGETFLLEVPLHVTPPQRPRSFRYDVLPILSKEGCNYGGCHGKAGGQRGFKLSLFEEDPAADYHAIVVAARGRRVFPAAPAESLLLRKATGGVTHGGGVRFHTDSPQHATIQAWIEDGMSPPSDDDAKLAKLSWRPSRVELAEDGSQQLSVSAHFDDGSHRDITREVVYDIDRSEVASVSRDGLLTVVQAGGLATVVFRYGTETGAVQIAVPFSRDATQLEEMAAQYRELGQSAVENDVDILLLRQWQRMAILPSDLADDITFLRRASLDICGTLPTVDEVRAFLHDNSPDKRPRLIDTLLTRPAYANYFAVKWADVLQNRGRGYSTSKQRPGTSLFYGWIRDSLASNKPYDEFVREIVTATGSQAENPPAVWYRSVRTLPNYVESIAQAFLGVRIQCAQCHHHPNDRWTQGDYFGLAAVFARVGRKGGFADAEVPTSEVIYLKDDGEVRHPKTDALLQPRPLGGPDFELGPFDDPRHALAEWIADPDNPFFAQALVNRMWAHFLGRGLVDPIDDARSTNPASHPELLALLSKRFVESDYDLKELVRTICNSRAYQLSSVPTAFNEGDQLTFARFYPRRLSAEVLLDAMSHVLAVPTEFSGGPGKFPAGTRAIELPDENVPMHFLDVFGRPSRTKACECERPSEATLGQALELVNSAEIQRKLTADNGFVARRASKETPLPELVDELFLRVLGRPPTPSEVSVALGFLQSEDDLRSALGSLTWSLLATNEFLFNH